MSGSAPPEFDYTASWNAVRGCFESHECPPALRYWALTQLGTEDGPVAFPEQEIQEQRALLELCARQREDGSFGEKETPSGRILPSLWALQSLTDLGATVRLCAWRRCAVFLLENAVHEGGFAFDGRRDGVLSCYTGMFAALLLRGLEGSICPGDRVSSQFRANTEHCLDWLETYQAVGYRGHDYRSSSAAEWGAYLKHRFGGCFAATSCLSGVVHAGRALLLGERRALLPAIREYLIERHVYKRADGGVIPLWSPSGADEAKAAAWLSVSFPQYYHVDLLEALDLVASTGPYDPRLRDAIALICSKQLPNGMWPLEHRARHEFLHAPERISRKRGSRWATFRALHALRPLYDVQQQPLADAPS